MRSASNDPPEGIALGPCQLCNELKTRFYLCSQNHSTCEDCMATQDEAALPPLVTEKLSPSVRKDLRFSLPETPGTSPQPPKTRKNRLSPSSSNLDTEDAVESPAAAKISPRRSRSPSNDPPSIFSSRSPIKSLVTIPKPSRKRAEEPDSDSDELRFKASHLAPQDFLRSLGRSPPPPVIVEEDCSDMLEIFCAGCGASVEATLMTLPLNMLKSLVPKRSETFEDFKEDTDDVNGDYEDTDDVKEDYEDAESVVPATSVELYDDDGLRRDVDELRLGLVETYSELLTTRNELDEVIYATEKLEMDVDMLRGGVNYLYFNFDTVLKRGEVRTEERICGIPFVLMVRLRNVSRIPFLGFFIGLEPQEGRTHSPLKKIIVLRAHNAYGKVIEKHALETFENGQCAHPCFDATKRQDGSLFGYANFLKKDRIMKPDTLKNGILCLSLQIKPFM